MLISTPDTVPLHADARTHAHASVTARLLSTGRVVATCSLCAVAIAALALLQLPDGVASGQVRAWGLWTIVVAGMPAAWYAWRVRLDEGLFVDLAEALATAESHEAALMRLDTALTSLGLRSANDVAPRSLRSRCNGARRQLIAQGSIAILQCMAVVVLLVPGGR